LTDSLRAKTEAATPGVQTSSVVVIDKVIVKESRLPSGPPKEEETQKRFSITQGGYVLKNNGEKFSTEVGFWRHIDIIEGPSTEKVRMGILQIRW
jgi:hypothetical protein